MRSDATMMMSSIRTTLICLILPGLLAACGSDADPRPSGSFALVRTQRGEIPAVLGNRDNCLYTAVGGSVVLRADSFDATLLRMRECLVEGGVRDGVPEVAVDTFTDRGSGTFELEDDSVFFHGESGAGAGIGVLRGDTLVVQGPGQTMYYRREPRG